MISDEQIIGGCVAGKRKAFNMLYRKYAPVMLGVCLRYSDLRTDAEDILQDGFIKVFSNIANYRGEGSFEGWMKRIMINTAIDHYQRNQKHGYHHRVDEIDEYTALADQADHDPDPPSYISIPGEKLMEMIRTLPDGYRMVFNLYAIEGYSHKEISGLLGFTENTSKTQLMKARKALRKMLEEWMKKNELKNSMR